MSEQLVRDHLRRWAEELVDLTRRNRLLYFRHTASASFEFAQAGAEVVAGLGRSDGWGFHLPEPPPEDPDEPVPEEHPARDALMVSMTPARDGKKIERGLKNLAAKSQSEFLDAGIWVLYLGLGRLDWVDVDDKKATSPLLLVPVALEKTGAGGRWRLTGSSDGEPALNPALAVKLDKDFGISLPALDDLAEPELPFVLDAVREVVADSDWVVSDKAVLTTFTFQKEVIYRDLMENEDEIVEHDTIRLLAEGPASDVALDIDFAPEDEEALDDRHPPEDLSFIRDADATQRQCLIAARSGRSFVMEGPPGTGKSQTITNVIAQLMADGKTILFVSEKAAALEVVQNRLAERSLDPFVLALHSHNATRKAVAQELGRALSERPAARTRFEPADRARLIADRGLLTTYAAAVNEVRTPLQRSLHDVIGRISQLDRHPATPVPDRNTLPLTPDQLGALRAWGEQLGRAWGPISRAEDFVWRELRPAAGAGAHEADLRRRVDQSRSALRELESVVAATADELRLSVPEGPSAVGWLVDLLDLVQQRQPVGEGWLSAEAPGQVTQHLLDLAAAKRDAASVAAKLDGMAQEWPDLDVKASGQLAGLEASLAELTPPIVVPETATRNTLAAATAALGQCVDELTSMHGDAKVLATAFGLGPGPTVSQARRLAELGNLIGSPAAPEPAWMNPVHKAALDEARRVLADLLRTYRSRREALQEVFTDAALDLDLQALHVRFTETHTGLGKLSGAYREDKKALASATVSGKVTKSVLARLDEAIEWKQLAERLTQAEARHAPQLGARYYPSRDGADLDEIERAVAVADQALALASGEIDTEHLASQLGRGSTPNPEVPRAAQQVTASLGRVDRAAAGADQLAAFDSVSALPIEAAAEWCRAVAQGISSIVDHMCEVEGSDDPMDLRACRRVLEMRLQHSVSMAEISATSQSYAAELGPLGTEATPAEIEEAAVWVRAIHHHFDGSVKRRTAPILLQTTRTRSEVADVAHRFEKATTELTGQFLEPYCTEIERGLTATFGDGLELLDHLHATVSDASEWESHVDAKAKLANAGWGPVVDACESLHVLDAAVPDMIERAVLSRWTDQILSDDPRLLPRRSVDRDTLREDFKRLDEALVQDAAANVINSCAARRPRSLVGEAGVINQQAQLKRRHKPVRRLLSEAGRAAQQLKPCFMMSPLSVSQFLPPGLRFDVVIFDEASQVREADSICCVYRGDQLIVAGDPRQLPPTSFFQKTADVDEDDVDEEVLDFESILDRCKAQGFPPLPLSWHYRSRHESLITFSNYSFYEGRLHTFPGATFDAPDLGVELFRVPGEYRRGGTRDNPIEAAKVVDRIVFHRRNHPDLTIGVVTLSVAQQICIEAEIERRTDDEQELRELMTDDRLDGFFVKNLENVQGDERDLILISVGYGPDEVGKLTMNFGPMTRPGGERRLNVAVTRAKNRVEVVSSISAGQITSDNPVTRHLARYLDYAERGSAALALDLTESLGDTESPFEEEVLRSVQAMGYDPVPQVGVAGYRIDIGVKHPAEPGSYVLGIECDGATYHSSKVARDRDRLRQTVLEGLGWHIHRIWSTAWFSDRPAEEARLKAAIDAAVRGEISQAEPVAPSRIDVTTEEAEFDAPPDWAWVYNPPVLAPNLDGTPFTAPEARQTIAQQIKDAVEQSGPIHEDEVLTAIRISWDIGRAGERIRAAYREAIAYLTARNELIKDGRFLSVPGAETEVRTPGDVPEALRKVAFVPPIELQLAILKLLEDAGPAHAADLRVAWARLFGWRRVGADIEIAFDDAIDALMEQGRIDGPESVRLLQ